VRSRRKNKAGSSGMPATLKHKRFRRFWFGQLFSAIGDGVFPVVLVALLLARGESHRLGVVRGAEAAGSLVFSCGRGSC